MKTESVILNVAEKLKAFEDLQSEVLINNAERCFYYSVYPRCTTGEDKIIGPK